MQCVGLPKPEQVGNETCPIVCSGAEEALCCLCSAITTALTPGLVFGAEGPFPGQAGKKHNQSVEINRNFEFPAVPGPRVL